MSKQKAAEILREKGCRRDHEFKATRKLHTYPATIVYECQDCPNEAHVTQKIPDDPTVGEYVDD